MKPNYLLTVGDKVITRRGAVGTIKSFIGNGKIILETENGDYLCVIQACKEYKEEDDELRICESVNERAKNDKQRSVRKFKKNCDSGGFWEKETTIIERDLEILEILKRKLKVKSYELGIEDIFICEEDEDDYKIVREWLENE